MVGPTGGTPQGIPQTSIDNASNSDSGVGKADKAVSEAKGKIAELRGERKSAKGFKAKMQINKQIRGAKKQLKTAKKNLQEAKLDARLESKVGLSGDVKGGLKEIHNEDREEMLGNALGF